MNKKEIIKKLKDRIDKFGVDFSHTIYLKEPVVVGKTKQGDVIAVSYERNKNTFYDYDNFILQVLYNWEDDSLYGRDSEFTSVIFENNETTPTFISKKGMDFEKTHHDGIEIFDNALQLVYDQAIKDGDEWAKYQANLITRSRLYLSKAVSRANNQSFRDIFTWEERLDFARVKGEREYLMYRRPLNHDYKTYCHMLCLGEKEFNRREIESNKRMMELLKD